LPIEVAVPVRLPWDYPMSHSPPFFEFVTSSKVLLRYRHRGGGLGVGAQQGDRSRVRSLWRFPSERNHEQPAKAASTSQSPIVQKMKRRYLSAEKKFQIYLRDPASDQPSVRSCGGGACVSTDLARIRQQVRKAPCCVWEPSRTQGGAGQHESYEKAPSGPEERNAPWPSRRSS